MFVNLLFFSICLVTSISGRLISSVYPNYKAPSREDKWGWSGHWFPYAPGDYDRNQEVDLKKGDSLYDPKHGIAMGISNAACDNGKDNLELDWNLNPENYTCLDDKINYLPKSNIHPLHTTEFVPVAYNANHKCMNESIKYDRIIPTYGTHRPLWAKFGEYKFLPLQRWLHNLEHGSIVMLYHPCANKNEVNMLRKIVNRCLYRHIITPYNLLSSERPLALVAWGHLLEIPKVSPSIVVDFIKQYALHGPERISRDGQYSLMLEKHADIVSDIDDVNLCPFAQRVF